MAQRVLKILLPGEKKEQALGLLQQVEEVNFWEEGFSTDNFVVSVLTEAEKSESVMDAFERSFGGLEGFRLIVYPVSASLPRIEKEEPEKDEDDQEKKSEKSSERVSREELYTAIADGATLSRSFIVMTVLATIVAAIGLLRDNVAVIIGAMVIAPFLGPNVALALSTCLAEKELGSKAIKTLTVGVGIALLLSAAIGYCWKMLNPGIDLSSIAEIASRTEPKISDIPLAFAAGCAGVWAFTQGTSSTLIGVMVAVALLPPLTVVGLCLGAANLHLSLQAFIIFITNIIGINLAGVLTFRAQGVTPRTWWEEGKAKSARRKAVALWSLSLVLLIVAIVFRLG